MWCIAELNDEYIKRMMDVLEVYERPYNKDKPVVCFDEKSKQLQDRKRIGTNTQPGKPKKTDYEYSRHGTVNLFVAIEPEGKRRSVTVTKRRTGHDLSHELERLVMKRYAQATKVVLVTDNLNVHSEGTIRKHLSKERAEALLDRIEWHYTPCHASWLNMAEIEISAISKQLLNRDIPTFQNMQKHTSAWVARRNSKHLGIKWSFTRKKAREKFKL